MVFHGEIQVIKGCLQSEAPLPFESELPGVGQFKTITSIRVECRRGNISSGGGAAHFYGISHDLATAVIVAPVPGLAAKVTTHIGMDIAIIIIVRVPVGS